MVFFALLGYAHPTVEAKVRTEKKDFDGNTIQNQTIIKPNLPTSEEEIKVARAYDEEQKKIAIAKKRKAAQGAATINGGYLQCVTYAKRLTGQGGMWGYGGRNLSVNSKTAILGAVVLMYGHVGVVDGVGTMTDANNDYHGSIRYGVPIPANIRGYHKF